MALTLSKCSIESVLCYTLKGLTLAALLKNITMFHAF